MEYRDITPGNIILDGATGRPKLTDFGVALLRSLDPLPSACSRI